jgi:hypothetical protein
MEAGGFTAIYDPDRELLTRVVHAHASAQLSGQSKEQIREAIENVVVDHFEREDCRRLAELVERIKLPAAVEPWRVQLDQTLEAYRGGLHEIASFAPVMIIEGASVGVARRMAQFLDKNGELDMAIEDWLQETGKVKPASKADQIRSCRNQMLARPSHAQVEGLLRASLSFVNAVPQLHGIYSALDFVRGKLYRHASGVPDGPDASRQLLSHYGLGSGKIATLQALLILEQISALLGMLDADLAEGGVA